VAGGHHLGELEVDVGLESQALAPRTDERLERRARLGQDDRTQGGGGEWRERRQRDVGHRRARIAEICERTIERVHDLGVRDR